MGEDRIEFFEISGARVAITNLTFSNGVARGGSATAGTNYHTPAGDGYGGAFNALSSVVNIANCKFVGNQAIGGEGIEFHFFIGIDRYGHLESGSNSFGGTIFSVASSVEIRDSSFTGSRALGAAPVLFYDYYGHSRPTQCQGSRRAVPSSR
jgi:hypothetical protein